MKEYKRFIAGLLAASIISSVGCSPKEKCANLHIERYYLENEDRTDDHKRGTKENVISSINDEFLSSLELFNEKYIKDERVEEQFKRIEGLKYSDNLQTRLILKKMLDNYEETSNRTITTDELTFLINLTIRDNYFGVLFDSIMIFSDKVAGYKVFENELGFNSYITLGSGENILTCLKIIKIDECEIDQSKHDYKIIDSYTLSSKYNDSIELSYMKIDNENVIAITDGNYTIYNNVEINDSDAEQIRNLFVKAINKGLSFNTILQDYNFFLSRYFDSIEFNSMVESINQESKQMHFIPKNNGTSV